MTGCAPQQPPTPDTRATDEAAIRAADTAWSKAAEAKQVDAHVAYYTADAIVLPPNEPLTTGNEAIRKLIGDFFAMPGFSVKWQPTKVEAVYTSYACVNAMVRARNFFGLRLGEFTFSFNEISLTENLPDLTTFSSAFLWR